MPASNVDGSSLYYRSHGSGEPVLLMRASVDSGGAVSAQLSPVCFAYLHAVVFGGFFYVGERDVAVRIADVRYLIKSRERAADMRRIRHRLLA